MVIAYCFLAAGALLISTGSAFVKYGIGYLDTNVPNFEMLKGIVTNVPIVFGYMLNIFGLFFWYAALAKIEYRVAFPIYISLLLIISQGIGFSFFSERLDGQATMALVTLILSAIAFSYLTAHK